jgi:alpha-D-ribose 1-methylphosphonate 5-triphosphate synthase subunit PhnH
MNKVFDFDFVFDSQQVYRKLLEAVSNPGRIVNINDYADKFHCEYSVLLCIAATLLDNEVSFAVTGNDELKDMIGTVTLSKSERIENADFIFVADDTGKDAVERAKCGTLYEPHKSALIVTDVEGISGSCNTLISGPGIKGEKSIFLDEAMFDQIKQRDEMFYEYPTGVDLLFADRQGNMMAIPRKIVVRGGC